MVNIFISHRYLFFYLKNSENSEVSITFYILYIVTLFLNFCPETIATNLIIKILIDLFMIVELGNTPFYKRVYW